MPGIRWRRGGLISTTVHVAVVGGLVWWQAAREPDPVWLPVELAGPAGRPRSGGVTGPLMPAARRADPARRPATRTRRAPAPWPLPLPVEFSLPEDHPFDRAEAGWWAERSLVPWIAQARAGVSEPDSALERPRTATEIGRERVAAQLNEEARASRWAWALERFQEEYAKNFPLMR